ncbi:hypothetical protein BGZ93_000224 [Podila epicladia]|nr:hypothetical protein BGZ92_002987 [Podila epicladia]KAG0086241.1 hypothetical protein BGZ93_000224 [Podila epicladia]
MNHSTQSYYNAHYQPQRGFDDIVVDEDEEISEDMFLQQHYGRPRGLGGLDLVRDDDESEDELAIHYSQDDDDEDDDLIDEEEEGDHEYNELDMDHQSIHLLSGSLSVRSPFLDAIREEEDEEPVFTKPSSYPSFGSSRFLNRNSIGENWSSSLKSPLSSSSTAVMNSVDIDEQQSNFNSTNQSDSNKPRGPRPPLLIGRPRSNSSLTRVTTGFDIPPAVQTQEEPRNHSSPDPSKRDSLTESSIQDLEVKRVMEGAAAAAISASNSSNSLKKSAANETLSIKGPASPDDGAAFGQDTQKSIDDFFGMVKSDLDKRIQQAIQEVEQKFLDRVQRLEEHTATLAGAPFPTPSASPDGEHKAGSLMESLTRPLPAHQNPGGSLALRKEILSHVTEKVGDLDLRVNQMEVLVSYKLVDIESKVQDLHGAHNTIAQKVHQVAKTHKSKMQGVNAGDGVGEGTIKDEEIRMAGAMDQYRDMDEKVANRAGGAYLENLETNEPLSPTTTSTALVDRSSIVELRNELQTLGMRYQELNDGLLTDLMGQMRDAKLMLFQTVDEVDGRISKRVDRIEAEMHSKLLSEIEGRVQERVRAMEQTSSRLERCFDKMEGRLGALETVLASRRPRPESMYQLLQQQHQQQEEENGLGYVQHAGTFAGFPSSPSHRSVTSMLFSDTNAKADQINNSNTLTARPRRALADSDPSSPDSPTPSSSNSSQENEEGLMMLEVDDHSSTVKRQHAASKALMSSPLDGFVSQAQAKPVWSSRAGGVTGSIPIPIPSRSEYKPATSYVPTTSYISAKEQAEKMSSGSGSSQLSSSVPGGSSRLRRVSLPSFDASSLSALKPVRAAVTAEDARSTPPVSTLTVTTSTTTTTTTIQGDQPPSSTGSVSSLTSKLKSSTSALSSPISPTGSGATATKTMQRAMTFDTMHSQATSTTKTSKTSVQGLSSYTELLHFWKTGGST